MKFVLQPWYLLACIVAGCANRQQQRIFGYSRTENIVIREKLGRRHIRLNENRRF